MKAFMTSIVALVLITAAAWIGLASMSETSKDAFTVDSTVRH